MKTKYLILIIAAIINSANLFAQNESSKNTAQQKSESTIQPQTTTETQPEATVVACNCSKPGFGCFPGSTFCIMACRIRCHKLASTKSDDSILPTVAFYLEKTENVSLKIYDMTGRLLKTLVDNSFDKGEHSIYWNRKDEAGQNVSAGIYSLKINADDNSITEKLLVIN